MEDNSDLGILLDNVDAAFALATPQGQILHASRALCQQLAYSREELEGLSFLDLSYENDIEKSKLTIEDALENRSTTRLSKQYRRKNGELIDAVTSIKVVYDIDSKPKAICIIIENVNENANTKISLQSSVKRAEAILQSSIDAIIEHDEQGGIISCNKRTFELFGLDATIHKLESVEQLLTPDLAATNISDYLDWIKNQGKTATSENFLAICSKNRETPIEISVSRHIDNGKQLFNLFIRDISDRKKAERKLRYLATHDVLTGLANRSGYKDHLENAITQYNDAHTKDKLDNRNQKFALLFVDLDNFKSINDSLGHHVGDQLLKNAAERIQIAAGKQSFVARMSGDEFIILTYEPLKSENSLTLDDHAEFVAQQILTAVNQAVNLRSFNVACTASVGIACFPKHGRDANALLKHADIAMYHAKQKGKNAHSMFDRKMEQHYSRKISLEAQLKKAIKNDELTVFYQPKFCLETMRINGVEALARWFKGSGEAIPPSEFIPIAENAGMILDFGQYFFEKTCSEFKSLYDQQLFDGRLAVNVSNLQFARKLYFKELMEGLKTTGFKSSWLELEITESMIIQDFEYSTKLIQQLQQDEIRIAMDDFGVGYSSLSYLQKLPVDCVKLDKSFVDDIAHSDKARLMVEFVIDLAKKLGLHVVAEGTETLEQLTALQAMGCDSTQGYYLSKPLGLIQLKQLIENNIAALENTDENTLRQPITLQKKAL